MKAMACAVLVATTLLPFSAFAQTTGGQVTRAEVRADLAQLEAVGYRPSTHDADYPNALMSAEAKVAAMQGHNGAYGGDQGGAHQTGTAAQ
ncbi:DUF4148 domain-containing protein [Caballeronia sp. NK8]|uniref:DUF4148 domain-containing protein n=1 Tax=Caballeronia sp. NK8 TaxID=140098 RepID=UPI001BB4FA5F|nr:DUF4148 domain-containing protein [Caballeronia sp. NK8]BCQ26290.1 DUF4148 domain-containing protein [Caballeronia sp. NK8]